MLCETRLSPHDLDTNYKIDTFAGIVRHDETNGNESRSFHGLAAYVKDHLRLCEINNAMRLLNHFTCAYTNR